MTAVPGSEKVILVVDDSDVDLQFVSRLLSRSAYQMVAATSGAQCLDIVDHWAAEGARPWAILLDLFMPLLNGFEVLQELKKRPELESVPVIIVSGACQAENRSECLARGARTLLEKPVSLNTLLEALEQNAGSPLPTRPDPDKVRVLLVDDCDTVRIAFSALLRQDERIEIVAVAQDGAQALTMVEALSPDVIVTDLEMPVMHGADFVREQMSRKSIPIIVFSGLAGDDPLTQRAMAGGAVAYLRKPAHFGEVMSLKERLQQQILKAARAALA